VDAGTKMGVYAGFDMPLFYPLGVKGEHLHTRASAGLFDISHMQHVEITGAETASLISRLCPYDAAAQAIGAAKYTFLLNENAGIIDDLIVTRLANDRYLIVANAGCAEKDVAHIQGCAQSFDATVTPMDRGFLALQGPRAEQVMTDLGHDVADMPFMTCREPTADLLISRTGYTGEDGFEIAMPVDHLAPFAKALVADNRVEWIGLAARDSLRLEAGLSLYGQDLSEEITPHEAGLLWVIPKELRSGGDYVGATALANKIAKGRKRMRVGLLAEGRPVRAGTPLINEAGEEIGQVTSGGFGPTLDAPMALGLIAVGAADAPIFADMRGKRIPMKRSKPPFVPHTYKRPN
jgi:aminomethyltransferase